MTATVFSDLVCMLGEGPAAHPALGRLFWFDILGRRLIEKPFQGGAARVHALPFMASMMAVVDDHTQLIAAEDGLYLRDVASGSLRLHRPLEADNPMTRSNDGRVHPSGALWIGTMGKKAETGAGALYWFFRGEIRRLFFGISIVNSIAFSPDGRIAYFADTALGAIWRIDTDPRTGLPAGERRVFATIPPGEGGPDGSVVDADGLLWNARWGGACLDVYAPDGRRRRSLPMPARQVSCPAFIGAAADRLIVTSATENMDAAALRADPLAGQTFLVDPPVAGRFDPPVALA
ncbi:MAG TPA: SMP-30/gluconolactonase/LRE family protein [Ferrovibrio sp.]|uniref:SMP-30/gluconolactonase/LRE family protein n=1 Tax=Ferrovibrio sp. TaxID=1917215 RepID=UPI002ED562EF